MNPAIALAILAPLSLHARIVINEVFYNAPSGIEDLEYIELHNTGDDPVDLAGWKFSKGLKFTFQPGTKIEAGGFVVLCRNEARFSRYYPGVTVGGTFASKLSNNGERLELSDRLGRIADTVKYQDRAPWPLAADGLSASLERICPDSGGDNSINWAASPFSADFRTPAGSPGRTNANYFEVVPPVISRVRVSPETPRAGRPIRVEASVRDAKGIAGVQLLYRVGSFGAESAESVVPMRETEDGIFAAEIPSPAEGHLLRYRMRATGTSGARRLLPSETEPRPTFSLFVPGASAGREEFTKVPSAWIYRTGPAGWAGAHAAFVLADPITGKYAVQDYITIASRKNGFELHFAKGDTFRQAGTVHLLARREDGPVLAERLSGEVYRRAGVASPYSLPVRLWSNDQPLGWHLLVEQPGRGFLRRQQLDDGGNLYKDEAKGRDVVSHHDKRTNEDDGADDLVELMAGLQTNAHSARWEFIRKQFDVEQVINYFAVRTLLAAPGEFSSHYLAYHDIKGTGRWTLYPRDQSRTLDDERAGAAGRWAGADWPLPFAASAPASTPTVGRSDGTITVSARAAAGPEYFSRPLLTQPEFRRLYLARTRELLETVFTEDAMALVFAALTQQLEPEVRYRATLRELDSAQAARDLKRDLGSLHELVERRRQFLLSQDEIRSAGRFSTEGLEKPVSRRPTQKAP